MVWLDKLGGTKCHKLHTWLIGRPSRQAVCMFHIDTQLSYQPSLTFLRRYCRIYSLFSFCCCFSRCKHTCNTILGANTPVTHSEVRTHLQHTFRCKHTHSKLMDANTPATITWAQAHPITHSQKCKHTCNIDWCNHTRNWGWYRIIW